MAGARRSKSKKSIEIYKHKNQKRKNNPQVGTVTSKTDNPKVKTKKYKYDPHLDPQLQWAGKAERLSFEVPIIPLHIHEKIDPRSIIETVRVRSPVDYEQLSLFHDSTEKKPLEKEIEFYKHEKLWSNRLIAGDSLLVMNSLLQKEGMAGKIQCIYIDPPYGIKYGSNFQPFVNKRDVKDGRDEDLTAEPETLKAFRDTWELGIHSYLSCLRDRLLLAKELLTESGSCFVQISDENVHLVRNLMDEIFGKQNFVNIITFRKTHINQCVVDSSWEYTHARELDKNKTVAAWVKNDHLGFYINYMDEKGKERNYTPDFIIKLSNKDHLILEVKGIKKKRDIQKWQFMQNWCEAVSQDLGQKWHFKISQDSTGGQVHKIIKKILS